MYILTLILLHSSWFFFLLGNLDQWASVAADDLVTSANTHTGKSSKENHGHGVQVTYQV